MEMFKIGHHDKRSSQAVDRFDLAGIGLRVNLYRNQDNLSIIVFEIKYFRLSSKSWGPVRTPPLAPVPAGIQGSGGHPPGYSRMGVKAR
jgi:hypothetical protein